MSTKDLSYYLDLKYPIEFIERANGRYFATFPDLDGCMAEGGSLEELLANLADAKELWIEARLEGGHGVPEPVREDFSGKLSLRMAPSLHAQLSRLADRSKVSLNLLINSVLASYAGGADPLLSILSDVKNAIRVLSASGGASATTAPRPAGAPMLTDSTARVLPFSQKGSLGG